MKGNFKRRERETVHISLVYHLRVTCGHYSVIRDCQSSPFGNLRKDISRAYNKSPGLNILRSDIPVSPLRFPIC